MRYNLRMIRSSKGGAEKPSAKYDRTLSR
jgi:hypothetical protein